MVNRLNQIYRQIQIQMITNLKELARLQAMKKRHKKSFLSIKEIANMRTESD